MTSPDAALAARPDCCSACGGAVDALGKCTKCSAAYGEAYRCPLCQTISDTESSSTVYQRCRVCGGPRIPPNESPISDAETALLRLARSEQLRAGAFKGGAGFALGSGFLALFVTSVVLLAVSPGGVAQVAALIACSVPFALSFFALQRSRVHARKLAGALQQAWLLAASRLVRARGGELSAPALASALRVDEARAEQLLAEVSVDDFVQAPAVLGARVRVTELAEPTELVDAAEAALPRSDASKP